MGDFFHIYIYMYTSTAHGGRATGYIFFYNFDSILTTFRPPPPPKKKKKKKIEINKSRPVY